MRLKAADIIYSRLVSAGDFKAIHELELIGMSECSASARLRELAREGKVVSRYRKDKRFKEWAVKQLEIPNDQVPNS